MNRVKGLFMEKKLEESISSYVSYVYSFFFHLCVPCFGLVYMKLTSAQKSDIP